MPRLPAERLLRRLEWTSLRRLDGLLQGDYRTLMRGSGLDLADLREYQYRDDVRRIDWNATARLAQPHVRDDLEDRELGAWFVLDLSPSVDFGSGLVTKRQAAAALCGLFGLLLLRHGNRFGAIRADAVRREVLPARSGRPHLMRLMDWIDQPPAAKAPPRLGPSGLTDLGALLGAAGGIARRRSLVVVLSDFISTPGWQPALARLSLRHDVLAVRLVDPVERALPDLGLVPMQDAETGDWMMVDTHDPDWRARHDALAREREEGLRGDLAAAGVDAMELGTDEDPGEALGALLQLRRLQARLRAGAASAVAAAARA
jgi:uncharacterized protein (DUF58 family)